MSKKPSIKKLKDIPHADDLSYHKFKLKKNDSWLFYFGAYHSNHPESPMLADLKKFWDEFLQSIETSKDSVVFVEGGVWDYIENEEDAIKTGGEASLTVHLATRSSIPIESPEPDLSFELFELNKMFSKEKIVYYYFARVVNQWLYLDSKPDFNTYIKKELKELEINSGWSDFDFSLNNMFQIHKDLYGSEIDLSNQEQFYNTISYPTQEDPIYDVIQESLYIRDVYVSKKILEKWNSGYNIFITFGVFHAHAMEDFLISNVYA